MSKRLLSLIFPFLYLYTSESGGGGATPPATPPGTPPATPPAPPPAQADIQAEVQKALAAQQAEFAKQFKAATGFDSLEAFQTDQAKKKGEEGQLLEQRTSELNRAKQELAEMQIRSALSDAAVAAKSIDPATVVSLLAAQGKVENGVVTVGGKPAAEAVAELLKQKPFLGEPGKTGSGSPLGGGGGGEKNPWSKEHFNLTEQGRIASQNPQEAERLKALAGK